MPTPEIVGYASRTGAGSLSLTSLSGGIGSAAAEGDLVMLALCSRSGSNVNISTPSGYDLYAQIIQSPLRFALYFKLQGSSPDTSITIPSATDVLATACVVRGVDPDEFFAWDQGEEQLDWNGAQGLGFVPDPGAVTTLYDNSLVLIPTARENTESTTTEPTGYTSLSKHISSKDWICIAAKEVATAGSEDPGAWQNATEEAGVAYGCFTVALKAAPGGGNIKVWNGSSWVAKPVKVWNGSSWVTKPVKRWNGSAWITTPY